MAQAVAAERGVVWVTGASSGLGQAAAILWARRGRTVVASARTRAGLDAAASRAEAMGPVDGAATVGRILPVPLDVTDLDATRAAVAHIEMAIAPIDIAVLNAGTHVPTPIGADGHGFDAAKVRLLSEINFMGVVNGLDVLLPVLAARRRGRIAVVASVAGYGGLPTAAAYGASKAALINLAEALHVEAAALGIEVRLVCPGFVKTPLTDRNEFPMPFLMDVDRAARRMVDALSRPGGFEVTFPRRFTWTLKLLRLLPYPLYFSIVRRATRA